MIDYKASVQRLSKRVKLIHKSRWSPTPEKKRLIEASSRINETAKLIDSLWYELEDEFDYDPPELDSDDHPIQPEFSNAGGFQGSLRGMGKLAELAIEKADNLPNPRQKRAAPFAAMGLLHIMYECEKEIPTLYDKGAAVQQLDEILKNAGIQLSAERVRGLLSGALKEFDPHWSLYDDFLAFKQ